MLTKKEYLSWFNSCVKTTYKVSRDDKERASLVYSEYVRDCEEETTHELPSLITKFGNPVTC